MNMEKMMEITNNLVNVKPTRYVFCWCASMAWALNVFNAYLPHQHQAQEKGGYAIKISKEALEAFKTCFTDCEVPEITVK